jgi:hypothetical protein
MDWTQITTSLIGALVGAIAWGVQRWLGIKMSQETRDAATWAFEQGVALASERLRGAAHTGAAKKQVALETAESLAPKAVGKLSAAQRDVMVDATYAKMRAKLPHPSSYSFTEEDLPS